MIIITGKFIKIKCAKCNNEQNMYSNIAMDVKCLVCGEILAKSTGGIANLDSDVISILK